MNDEDLVKALDPLKKDLAARPDKAQYFFNKHIAEINKCVEQRYSLKEIHNVLYIENNIETVTFLYFKNMIYRARKRIKDKQHNQTIREVINEPKEQETQQKNTIIKKIQNPLAKLEEPKDNNELHDSSSDSESLKNRMARMLEKKENKND